jgi:hypothetical protein
MYEAWYSCLYSQGVPKRKGGFRPALSGSKTAAAQKACAAKEPEDWMERLMRQHPQEYLDKARDTIRCMQAETNDFTVSKTDDLLDIDVPDNADLPKMLDLKTECEEKAFKVAAYRDCWPPFLAWQSSGASPRWRSPRLSTGLRKEAGRWVIAHEHHSFADTT